MSDHENRPSSSFANPELTNPARITKSLTTEAVEVTRKFGWDFFKAGVLIVKDTSPSISEGNEKPAPDLFQLVKEAKVKELQSDGTKKWVLSDKGKWNLPCGRLNLGESFEVAALREGEEETGCRLSMSRAPQICHIGHRLDPDNPYVIVIYVAHSTGHGQDPDPEEIAATDWFTYEQILDLCDRRMLRNPELVMAAIEGYQAHRDAVGGLISTYVPKLK